MGWWSQNKEGVSFAENEGGPEMVWGDEPADRMHDAVDDIVKAFERSVGRVPTKAEIRAGLDFHLAPRELPDE